MYLGHKRSILFLICCFTVLVFKAQTLYWVGGSGNFNDPNHWSLTSGGLTSNFTPSANSNVVFEGITVNSDLVITISNPVNINSLDINSTRKIKFIKDNLSSRLIIQSGFNNILDNKNFSSNVTFEFKNNFNNTFGIINSGDQAFNSDFTITGGKWKINKLKLENDNLLSIINSSVDFTSGFLQVGNFKASNCNHLNFDKTILKIYNDFTFDNVSNYSVIKSYLTTKLINGVILKDDNSGISNKFSSTSSIMSPCIVVGTVVKPSCTPGCDGSFVITIPSPTSACYGTPPTPPFNVQITNAAGCNAVTGLSGVGPGTYTITNVCACNFAYGILLFDQNGFIESDAASVTNPIINPITISSASINCNGACTGSIATAFTGGTAPYNFTVTPPTGPTTFSTSAGGLNVTNMCAGLLTIVAKDSKGCTSTFTFNVNQPFPLNPQGATTSVTCNGACTGIAAVTPTGGTASYTVTWSTGPVNILTAGQTSSITGLCAPAAITATIADSKGCVYPTFTTNITQPPALTVTATQTNVSCGGLCDGIASVTVTGGTPGYNYTWTPGPTVNSPSLTALCAGPQTVSITDFNNCPISKNFTITSPPPITITPTFTNASCNSLCNGTINAVASGPPGPFSYTLTSSSITLTTLPPWNNVCANSYTITTKQNSSTCFTTVVINLTQPPPLTITATTQSITCFGLCNGGATVSLTGGNGAPFGYTWTPVPPTGQGTATISNICIAGVYTVSVKDASNCPISTTVNIQSPPGIVPNITTGSLTCNSVCNGSINATPTGPAGPYSYTLASAASTIFTAPPYLNLCSGIYTLSIGYGLGCIQSFTVNIQQPNPLIPSISSTSITCFNSCNGTLAGSAAGGTPGYVFGWITPTGPVAGGALSGQCAGNYTFTVTDLHGCTASTTATLVQPPDITVTINPTNPTCFGGCNGVLSATVLGGTPGYTLTWSNGPTGSPDINLCAGTYTLVVNDTKGCIKSATAAIVSPTSLTLTQTTTSTSCAGSCNGSATITAIGGTPPYTYQFNTLPVPTTNTTGIIGGLCAGNYICNVTDANGCSQSISFSITSPIALSAAITGLQSSCNACTGASTVTASNGTPGYSYVWTNSLSVSVGTNAAVSSLCPGSYTATVTDSKGCTATATANIVQTVSVTVITAGSVIQCFGACTGSATANALGGTLPYNYSWAITGPPTQTTQSATNLCAGSYTVTVFDQLGCSATGTITFTNPPAIVIAATQTNVNCFGNCNGAINSNASGGTGPLSYSWTPGPIFTPNLAGLCAGTYSLIVTDSKGCVKNQTFSITSSPSITATFTTTNPTACIVNNGSICATPSGGTGAGYTYSWSPAGGTGSNTSCYSNLGAGSYSLIVADGAGCTTTLSSIITNPTGPTLNINTQSVTCFGANTGAATVTAIGTGPFTFTWTPVVGFTTIGNTSTASSLLTGTYNISVKDANGCITSQAIVIAQPAASLTIVSSVTNAKCFSSCNGSITVVASGGTPTYTYSWLPVAPPITGQGTPTVTNLCAGNYTLNITDVNSCPRQFTFAIAQPPALSLTTTASNVLCNGACNGSINVTGSGGFGPITFTWLPVGTFTGSTNPNIFSLCPAIYTVNASDGNNCPITKTVQIVQPTALTSTITVVNASCSNSCNATASLSVGGGVPTYSFSWSSGPAVTPSLGSLCPGNYTGTAVDANGCITKQPFVVTAPSAFNVTLTPTNPLCNAACNGSIATTLAGAQGTVSYNWAAVGAGQNPINLCAGNYTLTATDASGCVATGVANLVNPPALLANISTTNPACNGNCNGVAISTPANSVGTVNYTWSPAGPNSPTLSALCAGNYTIAVSDGNGCSDVQTFTLTNPPVLNVNPSIAPATCGSPNGSITVIATGGTPSYTFQFISPPVTNTTGVLTGLFAGIYTVVVNDANNCTNTLTIPLSNSNGPSAAPITSSSIQCNNQCTGAASVNIGSIVGGTPGYTISWVVPPSASTVNPQTGLCAGTYTAQINDANNCLLFNSVTITEPSAISILPNLTFPTCNGVCNGSIMLNPSGGTAPYTYTWSSGTSTTQTLLNACAGNYTINMLDNNLCPTTQTVNLPGVQSMTATSTVTNNLCFGNCNATASVIAISGSPNFPINYVWSNSQSGPSATNLCNGVYTYTATDAIGCFNTFTTNITSPTQITNTNSVASPSCNMCNGSSTITAFGGTAPYTYSWTSSAVGQVASNLCAGLYQVLVTDNNLCTQLQNIMISNSSGITGETTNIQNELCSAPCTGAATVTAIGGTAPISYNWISPVVSNSVITNLCPGTYFLQMTDAQGCVRTSSVNINPAPHLTLTPTINAPTCTSPNGTITLVPTGGTGPYSVSWVPGPNLSFTYANIPAGNYTVTVTDNGTIPACQFTQVFALNNPSGPAITFTQSNIDCFNACTGSITALATSTSTPVNYSWSNGANTPTVSGLCKGVITLTAADALGCQTIQSFTLTDNPALQLSLANVQQPKCHDDCNGAITLVPSGGSLPFTFVWSPLAIGNPQFSLCPGPSTAPIVYTGTVFDSKGCSISTSLTLINPAPIILTPTVTNSSCSSAMDGALNLGTSGGTPAYSYAWSGPGAFTSTTQSISNLLAGTYSLSLIDLNGCQKDTTLDIIPTVSVVAQAGNDVTVCPTPSVALTGTNSFGAVSYNWFLLPNITNSVANTPNFSAGTPTTAPGSFTYVLVTTSSVAACADQDTVIVNIYPLPFVDAGPTYTIPVFTSVTIGGNPTATGSYSLAWTPSVSLDNPSIQNPLASNTVNTVYTVTVIDLTTGCTNSDTMTVFLYPEIKVPNGFSPNGDSKNEKWIIDYIDQFPDNTVEVYNRWGEQLFYSQGYAIPFDGKYKGKDLPVGTYYYVINLNHPAYSKPLTGPLTIFR